MNTSIAATGAQRLLLSMDKCIPAPSGMQKQLDRVGEKIRTLNENDMVYQKHALKDVLRHGVYSQDTPIPAEADRQYNISLRNSRRKTPFAPATQTRDVLAEGLTRNKMINAFNHTRANFVRLSGLHMHEEMSLHALDTWIAQQQYWDN